MSSAITGGGGHWGCGHWGWRTLGRRTLGAAGTRGAGPGGSVAALGTAGGPRRLLADLGEAHWLVPGPGQLARLGDAERFQGIAHRGGTLAAMLGKLDERRELSPVGVGEPVGEAAVRRAGGKRGARLGRPER